VSDEAKHEATPDPAQQTNGRTGRGWGIDPRAFQQRNLAERLFPGPSRQMSDEQADHVEELLRSFGTDAQREGWQKRRAQRDAARAAAGLRSADPGAVDQGPTVPATMSPITAAPAKSVPISTPPISTGPKHTAIGEADSAATPTAPLASPADESALVSDRLEEQNELLRAILASSIDTQTDARSTAQNSRTFAWAGTVIALFTLIATVISIVAAVQGH
jgi:hypothetical protein